jgi:carbamoyltransferase
VLELISETISDADQTNCVLAGGLFANVRLNRRIKSLGFKNLYVYPAMGDEGLGLGAALGFLAPHDPNQYRLDHVYLGPHYSETKIEAALLESGLKYECCDMIEDKIAELLADGRLVARFAGPMEFGPRALGNRSILYQTTDTSVNKWLNERLRRTEFMPFAPVTLAERANELYEELDGLERCTRFMTVCVMCTDRMRRLSPAVVHVDGTARPQLIDRQTNPSYYHILERYYELTGIPSLINTSFNMHGEPIVCSPQDAIRCFVQGHLDYLAMGPFLIAQPK